MRRKMLLLLLVGGVQGVIPRGRENEREVIAGDLVALLFIGFELDAEIFCRIPSNFFQFCFFKTIYV